MKATTKIAATALLAAALPLTAQADRATDRAQALNAEPLAQVSASALEAAHQVGNAHIADLDAAYHVIFYNHFLSGKAGEDFNAQLFCLLGQPAA